VLCVHVAAGRCAPNMPAQCSSSWLTGTSRRMFPCLQQKQRKLSLYVGQPGSWFNLQSGWWSSGQPLVARQCHWLTGGPGSAYFWQVRHHLSLLGHQQPIFTVSSRL
jgi:hypothetical protein